MLFNFESRGNPSRRRGEVENATKKNRWENIQGCCNEMFKQRFKYCRSWEPVGARWKICEIMLSAPEDVDAFELGFVLCARCDAFDIQHLYGVWSVCLGEIAFQIACWMTLIASQWFDTIRNFHCKFHYLHFRTDPSILFYHFVSNKLNQNIEMECHPVGMQMDTVDASGLLQGITLNFNELMMSKYCFEWHRNWKKYSWFTLYILSLHLWPVQRAPPQLNATWLNHRISSLFYIVFQVRRHSYRCAYVESAHPIQRMAYLNWLFTLLLNQTKFNQIRLIR